MSLRLEKRLDFGNRSLGRDALTSFSSSAINNASSSYCSHAYEKTMFLFSFSLIGLKWSFHNLLYRLLFVWVVECWILGLVRRVRDEG